MVATKIILHEAHNFDCIEIDSRDVHENVHKNDNIWAFKSYMILI